MIHCPQEFRELQRIVLQDMREQEARLASAFSHKYRVAIMRIVRRHPTSPREVAELLGCSPEKVRPHFKCLVEADLVELANGDQAGCFYLDLAFKATSRGSQISRMLEDAGEGPMACGCVFCLLELIREGEGR